MSASVVILIVSNSMMISLAEVTKIKSVSHMPMYTYDATSQSLNCTKILLEEGDFERFDNGTVYVEPYNRIYQTFEYGNHSDGILVCSFTKEMDRFSPILDLVTPFGLCLSCIGILLHLIAFTFVPDLNRNLIEQNLAALCIALLASYVTFVMGNLIETGTIECFISAAAMYYFFLSSFCWMNIIALNILRTLRMAIVELEQYQQSKFCKIISIIYGCFIPLIALFVVVLLDKTEPEGIPTYLIPSLGQRLCWFEKRSTLTAFFVAPLGILMLFNFIFFILSLIFIDDTDQQTRNARRKLVIQKFSLSVLIGLPWASGYVAGLSHWDSLWFIFVLLNTLQGAFIFLFFTPKRKLWGVLTCRSWSPKTPTTSISSNISV